MELIATYMFLALAISAMCSVLEATLLSTPMSFVTTLETQGAKGAQRLKNLKQNIDRPISAILVVNTIANTVGASLVGSQAAQEFNSTGVGIVSAIFTLLILIFSEIVPKTIGSCYWRKLAIPASGVIRTLIVITYPLVFLIERLTHLISSGSNQVSVSREEVSAMVTVGAEEGVLQKKENKMIQNLLKLDEITAHQIMTPSVVVAMADSSMNLRDFYKTEEYNKYSRIPIYDEDNSDYITGYVLRQTILERLAEDKFNIHLKDLARPILSFPESEPVANIWEKLLEKKEHISIIIDEYGSLRGIVTMEDVIETMLGFEIVDEKDEVVDMQEYAKAQWKRIQKKQQK
ncbi:MAG: hemolysin family protein [Bacteroides sp.]|nr:hemolysin family protein [Roseburia sp.]MCM1345500.1 hemolysin family protein [Bacteroides sp.]MCM1420009.1 hemolysin family protein [Bacteroides sp.]